MAQYRTLTGRQISLDQLSPQELQIYLEFVDRAGGPVALGLAEPPADGARVEEDGGEPLPDAGAFRAAYGAACARVFEGGELQRARSGPLGEILDDLALRLEQRQTEDGYPWADPFNPARFLARFFREECSSVADFSARTGIEYSHASRVLRGEAQVSLKVLRDVAERTGYAFDIVRRGAAPAPEVVSVRDYSLAAFGQRAQVLRARLLQAGLPELVRPVLDLECRARTGAVSNALLVTERRARILDALDATEHGRGIAHAGPALYVVSLAGREAQKEQLAWLFLGVEFGWFESRGYLVALTGTRLEERRGTDLPRPAELRVGEGPPSRLAGASWPQLYMDAVHRILHALPAAWESQDAPRGDPAGFARIAAQFRGLGTALLRDPALRWHVLPVVRRWCQALGWGDPDPAALQVPAGDLALPCLSPDARFEVHAGADETHMPRRSLAGLDAKAAKGEPPSDLTSRFMASPREVVGS